MFLWFWDERCKECIIRAPIVFLLKSSLYILSWIPFLPLILFFIVLFSFFFSFSALCAFKITDNVINLETIIKLSILLYIMLLCNIYIFIKFFYLYIFIIEINSYIIMLLFSTLSSLFYILLIFISSSVIIVTIDYLSIMESIICLLFIYSFIIVMIDFICFNNILFIFLGWDVIGIISYFCINFWSSKIRSGIKAIIYNKIGDCLFIMFISFYYFYAMMFIIHYNDYLLLFILLLACLGLSLISSYRIYSSFIIICLSLSIIIILFTKSAQYPFFSWLLNAMIAPTPISSLLHSSTMVISGVYLGLVIDSLMLILINLLYWNFYVYLFLIIYSLLWSLFKGISLSDMKSIIAYSTISQISYMFLCLLLIPHYVIYHIVIMVYLSLSCSYYVDL